MSRDYTYLLVDILSNRVVNELPLYGTWFQRTLSGTGNMTATVPMNASGFGNLDTKGSTIPGRNALYALCGDAVVWGGPIWSRTYNRSGKSLSLTGQTWESWAYKFYPTDSLFYNGIEQRNIAIDLFTRLQAVPLQNALFTLPSNYPMQTARTENFPANELKSYGDLVQYLTEYDTGFDFEIVPYMDSSGILQRQVKFGNPLLGVSQANSGLLFEYEGSISDYTYSENAAGAALKVYGVGADNDAGVPLRTTFTQSNLGSYPLLQSVYTNKDVTVQATLNAQTKMYANTKKPPLISWNITVDPTLDPLLGTWNLGDQAHITIEDDGFFPDRPFEGFVRAVGWELNPPSDSTEETLKLLLEEEDIDGG